MAHMYVPCYTFILYTLSINIIIFHFFTYLCHFLAKDISWNVGLLANICYFSLARSSFSEPTTKILLIIYYYPESFLRLVFSHQHPDLLAREKKISSIKLEFLKPCCHGVKFAVGTLSQLLIIIIRRTINIALGNCMQIKALWAQFESKLTANNHQYNTILVITFRTNIGSCTLWANGILKCILSDCSGCKQGSGCSIQR